MRTCEEQVAATRLDYIKFPFIVGVKPKVAAIVKRLSSGTLLFASVYAINGVGLKTRLVSEQCKVISIAPKLVEVIDIPNLNGSKTEAPISHDIVKHKTVKTERSSAANATVKKTEYSLQVKKSEAYTVGVTAVKILGVGEPAVITIKFTG